MKNDDELAKDAAVFEKSREELMADARRWQSRAKVIAEHNKELQALCDRALAVGHAHERIVQLETQITNLKMLLGRAEYVIGHEAVGDDNARDLLEAIGKVLYAGEEKTQ